MTLRPLYILLFQYPYIVSICFSILVNMVLASAGAGSDRWPSEPKSFTFYVEPMDGGDSRQQ